MYNIAQSIIEAATTKSLKLATAESITGGAIAAELTAVPGASQVFTGGFVVYTAAAKQSVLGVQESIIAQYGTVSAQCAGAMALGALRVLGDVDIALAATGNAGPTVDSAAMADKTVGEVYIAIATRESAGQSKRGAGQTENNEVAVKEHSLNGTRAQIRQQVLSLALEQLLAACEKF